MMKDRVYTSSLAGVQLNTMSPVFGEQRFPACKQYFPTLPPRRYNPLKVREIISHQIQEKENYLLRQQLRLPVTRADPLNKQLTYSSLKQRSEQVHPSFKKALVRNRRIQQFCRAKKVKTCEEEGESVKGKEKYQEGIEEEFGENDSNK